MYEEPVDSFQLSMGRYNLLTCENPNHEEHIEILRLGVQIFRKIIRLGVIRSAILVKISSEQAAFSPLNENIMIYH